MSTDASEVNVSKPPIYRSKLNNLLQRNHISSNRAKWHTNQAGPQHDGLWEAVFTIDDIEYGRGQGKKLSQAEEAAAEQAYREYFHHLNQRYPTD